MADADDDLEAARSLLEAGHPRQAVSRSYCAVFSAGSAALVEIDETRSKHSGVIAAFGRRLVKEEGFDPALAGIFRELFDERNEAACGHAAASEDDARAAVQDASRFVAAVSDWIAARKASSDG